MTFGEALRWHRERLGLSQGQLSRRCGLANDTVSRYEAGTSRPTLESFELIAEALGLSLNELRYPDRPVCLVSRETFEAISSLRAADLDGLVRVFQSLKGRL